MLKLFLFLFSVSAVGALPFLCRKGGDPPTQTGTCGLERTALHQGVCLCCFNNTADRPTIGVGFDLTRPDAGNMMAKYKLELRDVLADCRDRTTKHCLSNQQAIELYTEQTYPDLERITDGYMALLPPLARRAVVDVAFSGEQYLLDDKNFPGFRAALRSKNYKLAATNLYKSRWCKSVSKDRCQSDTKCIASLCTPGGTCNNYRTGCSSSNRCVCQQTGENFNVCAPNFSCNDYPNCSRCSKTTAVCVKRGCCGDRCIPLKDLDICPPDRTVMNIANSTISAVQKPNCLSDSDCTAGKTCEFHAAGKFCV